MALITKSESIQTKTKGFPDLKDLFTNLSTIVAEYALDEVDLASRLIFFLCGVETIYNLLLNDKFNPAAYNPSQNQGRGSREDGEKISARQFDRPMDNVWKALAKQINFRLETGSWYPLPFPTDQQFSWVYKMMVETGENSFSQRLSQRVSWGKNGKGESTGTESNRKPAKETAQDKVDSKTKTSLPQPGKQPRKPFKGRSSPTNLASSKKGTASKGKQIPVDRPRETVKTQLAPPLPNKTIRPISGTTGYVVLTDANGDPMPELYEFIQDTAVRISKALPSPSQWSNAVMHLLACLEANTDIHLPLNSALDNICRLITRRLNHGKWV